MKQINIELTTEEKAQVDSALSEEENKGFKKNFLYRNCIMLGNVTIKDIAERKHGDIKNIAVLVDDTESKQLEKEYEPLSEAVDKSVFYALKFIDGFKKRSVKNV